MQDTTYITDRGTLTLPAAIRKNLKLEAGQQLIVETTEEGTIVLRPALLVPVEIYSEARIAEFASEEQALSRFSAQ